MVCSQIEFSGLNLQSDAKINHIKGLFNIAAVNMLE